MLKRMVYLVLIAAAFTACSEPEKKEIEIVEKETFEIGKNIMHPQGIFFTEIKDYKSFKSIQMPYQGRKFRKQESGNRNDAGEMVPTSIYQGFHVYAFSDLSRVVKLETDKKDINKALEGFKKSSFLRQMLEKDNIKEEYEDVVIDGKTCKRLFVSYEYSKGDYSSETYTFGYIVPNINSTSLFFIDRGKNHPTKLEEDIETLDEVFKYMIETVKFREYKKK